ncbi:Ubiquitin carboxyl-terminal hydrolase 14 [Vanrija pseudolonga]|uniref:Ubiquitin carboxyl-terminal hydrolase n=1 Tax=Vanrija pseudolonga TaxID=143232 RepID=A0AAF0YJV5_9TREE|nr:Ubiquitin carboxyl-terminal hydrolase 14 [Vanrija pseudolonga]
MVCKHIEHAADRFKPPRESQQVHREECTLCFDGQDGSDGVLVCLQCFNGGCQADGREHAALHWKKQKHPFGVVIKRTRREQKKRVGNSSSYWRYNHGLTHFKDASEPPLKRLAISAPSDDETYEYTTSLRCFECSPLGEVVQSEHPNIIKTVNGIMKALSSAQQSEVKAWEEEIIACEHTLTLDQVPLIAPGTVASQCTECDLDHNLWMCLTCGLVNCGRKQFGGVGGNGHALEHYQDTGHPVGVKFGTITPEGHADIYCYACDDAKLDPDLASHLATFGMNVLSQTKTEKSMTELQLEHNLKFDFSMTGDDGKELEPLFGQGLTGLKNLGNSCYMASVMQTLFSLPAFRERYSSNVANNHFHTCDNPLPAECLECQTLKLGDGLVSGRYSVKATAPPVANSDFEVPEEPKFQEGIRPAQFKALIGKGHEEFSTMRQQDSEEFLQHLLTRLRQEGKRLGHTEAEEATNIVRFGTEQRLECERCHRVGYKVDSVDLASLPVEAIEQGVDEDGKKLYAPVTLEESLVEFVAPQELNDYACGNCGERVRAETSTRFKTFPDLLVLHMKKFQLVNWVPTKLDVPVQVPEFLNLDGFHGKGRQPGEEELDVDATPDAGAPEFNAVALAQLEAMGFLTVRAQKALLATGNSDADTAMNWLFEHMDDPDIDAPLQASGGGGAEPNPEQVANLADMGFTPAQARKALRETGGNPEAAVEWLFSHPDDQGEEAAPAAAGASSAPVVDIGGSEQLPANYRLKAFISHKGPSVHSGHYVATIRQPQGNLSGTSESPDEWVLFNDEKVARAPPGGGEQMRSLAYLYVYERV